MKLADIKIIQDILKNAFRIPYNVPLKIYFPTQSRKDEIVISNSTALQRCYYVQNDIVVIHTVDAVYSIPFTTNIERILLERGFLKKSMYVPFANKEYPLERRKEFERVFREYIR